MLRSVIRVAGAMFALTAVALPAVAQPAPPPVDPAVASPLPEADCVSLQSIAADANRGLPQRTDEFAETLELRVDCAAATVTFLRRLVSNATEVPAGYLDQLLLRHRGTHCGVVGLTTRFALTVVDEIVGLDGTPFATVTTAPSDCDGDTGATGDAANLLTPTQLDAALEAVAAEFRPHLPMRLDDTLILTGVFQGTGALVYFHRFVSAVPEADRPAMEATMRSLVEEGCADRQTRIYLRSGAILTYRYSDFTNTALFSITLDAAACGLA